MSSSIPESDYPHFKPLQRVKAHPATDRFMMGDVYGTVQRQLRGRGVVVVLMDRSNKLVKFHPENLLPVD